MLDRYKRPTNHPGATPSTQVSTVPAWLTGSNKPPIGGTVTQQQPPAWLNNGPVNPPADVTKTDPNKPWYLQNLPGYGATQNPALNTAKPPAQNEGPAWLQSVNNRYSHFPQPTNPAASVFPGQTGTPEWAKPKQAQGSRLNNNNIPAGQEGGVFDAALHTYTSPTGERFYVAPNGSMQPMGTSLSAVRQPDGTFAPKNLTGARLSKDGSYWTTRDGQVIPATDVIPGGGNSGENLPPNAISLRASNYRNMPLPLGFMPPTGEPPTTQTNGGYGFGSRYKGWGNGGGYGGYSNNYQPNWYLGLNSWNFGE